MHTLHGTSLVGTAAAVLLVVGLAAGEARGQWYYGHYGYAYGAPYVATSYVAVYPAVYHAPAYTYYGTPFYPYVYYPAAYYPYGYYPYYPYYAYPYATGYTGTPTMVRARYSMFDGAVEYEVGYDQAGRVISVNQHPHD